MKKCFIYGRVSRKQAVDNKDSITEQIEQLRQFARKNNLKVEDVCSDRSTNNIIGGPGFVPLLQKAAHGEVKTILCQDYSRITKSFSDWIVIKWILKKQGINIITARIKEKTELTSGKLIEGILDHVNALDHHLHNAGVKRGLQKKKLQKL